MKKRYEIVHLLEGRGYLAVWPGHITIETVDWVGPVHFSIQPAELIRSLSTSQTYVSSSNWLIDPSGEDVRLYGMQLPDLDSNLFYVRFEPFFKALSDVCSEAKTGSAAASQQQS